MKYLYPNLRAEMKRLGVKHKELADSILMDRSSFSHKICGQSTFTIDEAIKIWKALKTDLPIEVLFIREYRQ